METLEHKTLGVSLLLSALLVVSGVASRRREMVHAGLSLLYTVFYVLYGTPRGYIPKL